MQPGVYRGISNADYHGGDGHSKSGLDLVRKSPAHLRHARANPSERTPTPSQRLGTAFHALVLEPELFAQSYALPFVAPEGALSSVDDMKAALESVGVKLPSKAKKADFEDAVRASLPDAVLLSDARKAYDEANEGREVLSPEDWQRIHDMRDAVMAHPAARKLLTAPGEAELSAYWEEPVVDPTTGEALVDEDGNPVTMAMRCRPDFWRHDGILVDLKSTSPGNAHPEEFARSVYDWRYYVQHPLYLRGAAAALRAAQDRHAAGEGDDFSMYETPRAFVFVAVETDACVVDGEPKGVAVYQLQPDSVALGEAEIREDVYTLHRCITSGKWPGYARAILPLELPPYAFTKAAARMGAAA